MRAVLAVAAAALALVAGGCGSDEAATSSDIAAALLRPGALLYWETVSDPDSDQWNQLEELLRRFPDGEKWIAELKREVETSGEADLSWERDVEPALGDQVAVAVYAESRADVDVVGLTKPDDPEQAVDLVERLNAEEEDPGERMVVRRIGDWIAVSDEEAAIDAAVKPDGAEALADAERFREGMEQLPDDTLSRAYVDPAAALRAFGNVDGENSYDLRMLGIEDLDFAVGWAKARDDGGELGATVRGAGAEKLLGTGDPYASALLEHAPATAFAFYSIRGEGAPEDLEALRENPLYGMALREAERELGVTLEQLVALFDGEVALYAAPGVPFPELTLMLDAADPAEARASAERLLRNLTTRSGGEVTEDGDVTTAVLEGFTLNLGRVGDAVALSTTKRIFGDDRGDKLADSDRFEDALEAAGAPDEYTGLAYVDLAEAAELALGYVRAAEEDVPPEVSRNLAPLEALVAYGERDGNLASSLVFVNID